jgi:hypothetical protein
LRTRKRETQLRWFGLWDTSTCQRLCLTTRQAFAWRFNRIQDYSIYKEKSLNVTWHFNLYVNNNKFNLHIPSHTSCFLSSCNLSQYWPLLDRFCVLEKTFGATPVSRRQTPYTSKYLEHLARMNLPFFWLLVLEFYFLCRKVYALNAVGVIPEELWTLTFLTNLYGFFFICLFTWVLYEFWFPSFSCKLGDLEFVVHNINELKFMQDVLC